VLPVLHPAARDIRIIRTPWESHLLMLLVAVVSGAVTAFVLESELPGIGRLQLRLLRNVGKMRLLAGSLVSGYGLQRRFPCS
jgi:hypothetical protein